MNSSNAINNAVAAPAGAIVVDAMAYATALNALAGAALEPANINGHHFVMVPKDFKREDITEAVEKAQPVPTRKRGTVALKDVASFLAYCQHQGCADTGYIYADPDARTMTAVFNDHRNVDDGGWRDHRATLKAEYTPEFERWLRNSAQHKNQSEFSDFIEDNFADLAGDDAQLLLNVATTIQAKTDINFSSAKWLESGQVQLTYNEVINATAGANGALIIPKSFSLGLKLFKNGAGYLIKARLKYRLGQGGVKFWYELDRPEKSVEDAFAGYVDQVRNESGYGVLLGAP